MSTLSAGPAAGAGMITPDMSRQLAVDERVCVRPLLRRVIAGVGPSTVSKAYRLLRAILNTAFDEELIRRNPCRIKGAGVGTPSNARS